MKFTSSSDNLFKPVTISFTIESKNEYNSLVEMASLNVRIPNFVEDKSSVVVDTKVLSDFLSLLYSELMKQGK